MINDKPLTLREVAALTGLSLRLIERGCRRGTIQHTVIGEGTIRKHRRMYPHQVELLKAARSTGTAVPVEPAPPEPVDDIAAAIEATRRRQSRRTGRRRAA